MEKSNDSCQGQESTVPRAMVLWEHVGFKAARQHAQDLQQERFNATPRGRLEALVLPKKATTAQGPDLAAGIGGRPHLDDCLVSVSKAIVAMHERGDGFHHARERCCRAFSHRNLQE